MGQRALQYSYLRHRELSGCTDARLLAEVQEGLHPAGAVVTLGVDGGHVVVARLEDEVHHDPGLGSEALSVILAEECILFGSVRSSRILSGALNLFKSNYQANCSLSSLTAPSLSSLCHILSIRRSLQYFVLFKCLIIVAWYHAEKVTKS